MVVREICYYGFEHETLAEMLKKRQGWILSYNDCKEIRELYKGHHIINLEWDYCMNGSKQSNEVVIFSKDLCDVKNVTQTDI